MDPRRFICYKQLTSLGTKNILFYSYVWIWALSQLAWGEIIVIVNTSNPLETISVSELQLIYKSQLKVWRHQPLEIRAVHLPRESSLKKIFIEEILNLSYLSLDRYFQAKLSSGKTLRPPPATKDEACAIAYVKKYEGAIAYVSSTAASEDLEGVKIINLKC
jgi:ABC-type phosphate transport system substrate-binding protein